MHTVWELPPALLSCLPSLEHNPWHPLWIQSNQADKPQGPKAPSSGHSWKGPGRELAGGKDRVWPVVDTSQPPPAGLAGARGKGDEVAKALRLWTCGSSCLLVSQLTRPLCVFTAQPGGGCSVWGGGQGRGGGREEETTPAPTPVPEHPMVPQLAGASQVLGASEMSQVRAQSMVQRLQSCPTPARSRDAWGPSCSVLCSLCYLGQLTSPRWAFLVK